MIVLLISGTECEVWSRFHHPVSKYSTQTPYFKRLQSEVKLNANLMQQGNFIDVFLARHVSGTYAHHQER